MKKTLCILITFIVLMTQFTVFAEKDITINREEITMCVGLSAKVIKITDGTALVDASGAKRNISVELLEDLEPGDYVMVHAGTAIAKITDEDIPETDRIMEALG